jgi:hypothetical protein
MSEEEKGPKQEQVEFEGELKQYAAADPFEPFDIILTSGDRVVVTDPWRLAFTGNTIVWADPNTGIGVYRKNQIVGFQVHQRPQSRSRK